MILEKADPKEPTRNERKLLRRQCPKGKPPKDYQTNMGWLDARGRLTQKGREKIYPFAAAR